MRCPRSTTSGAASHRLEDIPPQVAGAIPDNAQHSRQDTVGRGLANGGEAYANTVDVSSSPCSGEQALGCRILDIVY